MSETFKQSRSLTKGRIVIARVLVRGRLVERPAVVVRVWSDEMINARVLLDGANDTGASDWTTSAHHSIAPAPNTWCWADEQDMSAQAQAD